MARRPTPTPPPAGATLVAYYRVSTPRQGESGLGLDAQRAAVERHARDTGLTVAASFTEVESGRRGDRPELARAVAAAKPAGGVLVVAKLDRLARDARFLLALVDGGVRVRFLDFPDLATDTSVGRLILTVMAAVAEFESRRIGERVRAALAARRARGQRHPRRSAGCQAAALAANGRLADRYRADVGAMLARLRRDGLTLAQIAAHLNAAGHRTRTGRPWAAANVSRLLVAARRAAECPD